MPAHTDRQFSSFHTQQLFDLVADIERYPEFLPWCRAARITERGEGYVLAELIVAFNHLTERYTSKVTLNRPADSASSGSIDVVMVSGPFEHLTNQWRFSPKEGGGTVIDFALDFKFRSKILEKLIGSLFAKAALAMASAFSARAQALYGASSSASH